MADFGLTIRRSAYLPPASESEQAEGRSLSASGVSRTGAPSEISALTGVTGVDDDTVSKTVGRARGLSGTFSSKDRNTVPRRLSGVAGDMELGLLSHLQKQSDPILGGIPQEEGKFYGIQGTPQWMVRSAAIAALCSFIVTCTTFTGPRNFGRT